MAERVNKLPAGLREDANLNDGIYVGSRYTDLNFACASCPDQTPKSEQTPKSVYIDDKKGEVYIPAGKDVYLKLDEEDGIEKEYTFGKRLSMWWKGPTNAYGESPPLKYLFGGSDRISFKEVEETRSWGMSSDFYAYVLDHASEPKFQKDPEVILAASRWFGRTFEAVYHPLAKQKLLELASNSQVDGKIRLEAAEALGKQALLELAKDQTLAAGSRIEAIEKIANDFSEESLDLLLEIFNDPTADGEARVYAVERMGWVKNHISEQKIFPERVSQVGRNLVKGLENWQGKPETRYEIGKSLKFNWSDEVDLIQLFGIFYQTAINPNAAAGDRVYAWKYVLRSTTNEAKREEAFRELVQLTKDQTVEAEYRLVAGRTLLSDKAAEPYWKETAVALLGLLHDSKADVRVRYQAGVLVDEKSSDHRQAALAGWAELLDEKGLEDWARDEMAGLIFLKGEDPNLLAKAIDFYLEREEGVDGLLALFAREKLSREAILQRLELIKGQVGYGWDRVKVALYARKFAPETAPASERNKKLIVQIEQ